MKDGQSLSGLFMGLGTLGGVCLGTVVSLWLRDDLSLAIWGVPIGGIVGRLLAMFFTKGRSTE